VRGTKSCTAMELRMRVGVGGLCREAGRMAGGRHDRGLCHGCRELLPQPSDGAITSFNTREQLSGSIHLLRDCRIKRYCSGLETSATHKVLPVDAKLHNIHRQANGMVQRTRDI
jgi:hypothetical protein